jgi:glycosyltransferase involved in cell wall biosynthesis
MHLSVIVCTHNPRRDYLACTVEALRNQRLSQEDWELIVVDNASDQPTASWLDVRWHRNARQVREDKLGLTAARLRGIAESKGENLVFVDDDNVLATDYLREVVKIGHEWPRLGAWGGSISAKFETPPPAWSEPYLRYLAIREVKNDSWSNFTDRYDLLPWGAGLCVRRTVALEYARLVSSDPMRADLDRRGEGLASCGDSDRALVA